MGWIYLLIAATCEIFGGMGLHFFSKKRNLANGALYFGGLGLSLAFLYAAFNYLQISVAYAVWTGIGTAGIVIVNMLLFGESKSPKRILSLIAIILGVVGLKVMG